MWGKSNGDANKKALVAWDTTTRQYEEGGRVWLLDCLSSIAHVNITKLLADFDTACVSMTRSLIKIIASRDATI